MTVSPLTPDSHSRRSQLYRWHIDNGAEFIEYGGQVVVGNYGDQNAEAATARQLGICDLSTLQRHGITGSGAANWLQKQSFRVPTSANESTEQANGDCLARLSDTEFLLLANPLVAGRESAAGPWVDIAETHAYGLPRRDSHCWFAITGSRAAEMFSTICGVDLRAHKFSVGAVAQTSVARVNAIVLQQLLGTAPCFYLLSDAAFAEYLWDCVLDSMHEFAGTATGLPALQALAAG